MKFTNSDGHQRYWPEILLDDGSMLVLKPGEEVELDESHLGTPHLNPVEPETEAKPAPSRKGQKE